MMMMMMMMYCRPLA